MPTKQWLQKITIRVNRNNYILQHYLHRITSKQAILVKFCQCDIHYFAFEPYKNSTLLPFFSYEMIRNFSGISISIKVFFIQSNLYGQSNKLHFRNNYEITQCSLKSLQQQSVAKSESFNIEHQFQNSWNFYSLIEKQLRPQI